MEHYGRPTRCKIDSETVMKDRYYAKRRDYPVRNINETK